MVVAHRRSATWQPARAHAPVRPYGHRIATLLSTLDGRAKIATHDERITALLQPTEPGFCDEGVRLSSAASAVPSAPTTTIFTQPSTVAAATTASTSGSPPAEPPVFILAAPPAEFPVPNLRDDFHPGRRHCPRVGLSSPEGRADLRALQLAFSYHKCCFTCFKYNPNWCEKHPFTSMFPYDAS